MLRQCSRATPSPGQSTWQPTAADVLRFEAALPHALVALPAPGGVDWRSAPQGWAREYVGIVRGGRRLIYGNFYPDEIADTLVAAERRSQEPIVICDGGPGVFGAEYDVAADRITHLAFNGAA